MSVVSIKDNTARKEAVHDSNTTFFRNVIRQHWEGKLAGMDKAKSRHVTAEIDSHLSNMNPLVDKLDYEIFCVPNIIAHSRHITKEEFSDYLKLIESLALGYSSTLGRERTSLMLIGLTTKARNLAGAVKYYKSLATDVQSRVYRYESAITRRRKRVYSLAQRLKREEGSILRFFRRKRIVAVNKKIDSSIKEIEELNLKLQAYSNVSASMREKTSKVAAVPPSTPPIPPSALPPRKD